MDRESTVTFIVLFLIVLGIISLISIAIGIIGIIANWKLYEKAGEPGWSAIVPVYNMMQMIKIATGDFKLAWVYLGLYGGYFVLNMISSVLTNFATDSEGGAVITMGVAMVMFPIAILMAILGGYTAYMFAKSYGKSDLFCVLSIFFSGITFIIMGFDKSTQYVGPKGVPQYNNFNNYNNYY